MLRTISTSRNFGWPFLKHVNRTFFSFFNFKNFHRAGAIIKPRFEFSSFKMSVTNARKNPNMKLNLKLNKS